MASSKRLGFLFSPLALCDLRITLYGGILYTVFVLEFPLTPYDSRQLIYAMRYLSSVVPQGGT
jgi:hypothetical protein